MNLFAKGDWQRLIRDLMEVDRIRQVLAERSIDWSSPNVTVLDELVDVLGDLLCESGFKADWEPNAFGLQVEGFIDRVNQIRYSLESSSSNERT